MKLQVNVFKARGLAAKDSDGSSDPYVQLQLGRTKSSTAVIHKCLNPVWNEEFFFLVDDLQSELVVTVWDEDAFKSDFLGQLKIPVSKVLHADNLTIPARWYPLQKRSSTSKSVVSGEILMSVSLYGKLGTSKAGSNSLEDSDAESGSSSIPGSPVRRSPGFSPDDLQQKARSRLGKFSAIFGKKKKTKQVHPGASDTSAEEGGESTEDEGGEVPVSFFDEDGPVFTIPPADEGLPAPLSGGILLDKTYSTSMRKLCSVLFRKGSEFLQEVAAVQGTTELVEGNWMKLGNENPRRIITYTKAATSFVKALKASEEQVFLQADDQGIVVLASVSTPEVIYGSCFKTEVQFCITPVSGDEQCHLRISWRVNFLQNTMMKGPIESGAKKGLSQSYKQYEEVLAKYVKPVDEQGGFYKRDQEQEQIQPKSDWELLKEYVCTPVVCLTLLLSLLMLLHIYLARPSPKSGLEFWELDLPDSLTEFLTSAALTYQLVKIFSIASRFLRARFCVVGDHGIKAKGEGWLLSVTLVEAENLASAQDACVDPFVVFSCGGHCRRSSVKLQTTSPKWGEIFEFDATEDPPSTLDIEVFNYDGPFSALTLGYAEVNFLKYRSEDLADIWISLKGKTARACGSRVRLRIFLTSTKETDTIVDYMKKVEKEVGTKIANRSKKNASFQKLFSLPAEEFLINDFACAIKRKIPLQGRMFLSPRMLGFYSNIFGHKTKFSLLWTDIEDVEELPPSLANVGPSIVLYARKGRALDASQGAKTDVKGRLIFQFQSFVHPGPAFRTLMTLWKNRTLTPEQRLQLVENAEAENEPDEQADDSGEFLGVDDAALSEVFATSLPVTVASMIALYEKENLEQQVMSKLGCLNYVVSPWENVGKDSQQRQVNYKLDRQLCLFGSVVTGTQQTELSPDKRSLVVQEILTLHDVPFGDNFQIHVRTEVQTVTLKPATSTCKVYMGIVWQKGTSMQTRITNNVYKHFTDHLKEKLKLSIDEILALKDRHEYVLY